MDMQELTVTPRDGKGKQAAKRLRRSGRIPAVLYGGKAPQDISIDPKAVLKMIHGHEGSTQLLSLKFDGAAASGTMAIIRDMQFDPVSEDLLHVDLQEVSADRAINVRVAVHPVGEAVGVRDTKGILNLVLHELDISCLPTNIPQRIDADVSELAIGDVLAVRDLTPPPGVRILNDPGQAVATVSPPMAEEEVAPAAAAATVAATPEPEVLTERKPKEEAAPAAEEGKKPAAKK
ncbi:MAG: 50S ribosomal protein L25 [Candidatus Rokubacteria bacterium]|nr:50S ribosomal protein L25 [Candidatus Rokubacteria bacterium]